PTGRVLCELTSLIGTTAWGGAGFLVFALFSARNTRLRCSLRCAARSRPRRHCSGGGCLPSPTPPEVDYPRLTEIRVLARASAPCRPSRWTRLERLLSPASSAALRRGTPKCVASVRSNSSFAAPSTGGAAIATSRAPSVHPTTRLFDARGFARTR